MTTETQAPSPPAKQTPTTGNGRRIHGVALISVLVALMLTLLLEALDQTVVGTALPKIVGQLKGFDRYTWVVTAYLLTSTMAIPVVGKLSDQFGRKWFLVFGTVLFLLGSVLSGAAQTMNQLVAFRALQGLGAGIGIALVFTVVGDIFPPAERAKWGAMFGAVFGISSAVGPTLGGWLTDHGWLLGDLVTPTTRWRWVFYINLPLGLIALAALLIYLPANISVRSSRHAGWAAIRRIDFPGAVLAAAATICLLLGLTWGGNQTYDWGSPQVAGILVAAGVLYLLFVLVERFAAEPILPFDLFRNQVFAAASVLGLLQSMILLGLFIYLPLFLQGVLGESPTYSGALITPMTISLVVGASVAGVVLNKRHRYQSIVVVGGVIMTVGVFLMTRMTISTSNLQAAIFMVIAGLGLGSFFSVLTLAAQNALPVSQLGVGTGASRYLGQLGATLGIAVVGTVVNRSLSIDLASRLPADTAARLTPAGLKAATDPQVLVNAQYHDAIVHTATGFAERGAIAKAAASVPPGPNHNHIVASITPKVTAQAAHQVTATLDQVFAALKQSLAVAVQHGFVAVLLFSIVTLLATYFLKDVPLADSFGEASG
jgi:EmrB/QacA subfamily drug resistance transporter